MAFFLPSSTSSSTTTSLSSSPLPVPRSLQSEDEDKRTQNELASGQRNRSDDIPTALSRLTVFGLLTRRISGASDSEISSLEEDTESEVESSWTRRATFGDDTDGRSPRSTRREDARAPSRGHRHRHHHHQQQQQQSPLIREMELPGPSAGTSHSVHVQRQTPESNVAYSSTNQIEGEEAINRRRRRSHRRHDSTEMDRSARREAKLHSRRRRHVFEAFICTLSTTCSIIFL